MFTTPKVSFELIVIFFGLTNLLAVMNLNP